MAKKLKKCKKVQHATYNEKAFLVPTSINSMAAIFTKVHADGTAVIRISDCHNSIKLWNDLNDDKQVIEMLQKCNTIISKLEDFRDRVKSKLNHYAE
jgi:hypothetical protein